MKCPFLEEVVVRYCNAYPIRKPIPSSVSDAKSRCLSDDHCSCPQYGDVSWVNEQNFEEVSKMSSVNENTLNEMKEAPGKDRPCVWAKLGVVSYRLCTIDYKCDECAFNQSLMDANGKLSDAPEMLNIIGKLRDLPATERKCRYMLTGDTSFKLCPNNYQCGTCEYDQEMHDAVYGHPKVLARMAKAKRIKVDGFTILSSLYFSKQHTWVKRMSQNTVRVGLDDFAQRLLGNIEAVNFPTDEKIMQGKPSWGVKSKLGLADLIAPVNGVVKKMNEDVIKDSTLLNSDPYDKGWILELELTNPDEDLKGLKRGDDAKSWLSEEIDRLHTHVDDDLGITVADGGDIVQAITENISAEKWNKLVKNFLS
jgi:glycine cleavage system H lipoate-binding protein